MARDATLRWLLDNDPAATTADSTAEYLRRIGCGNAVKRYKTEYAASNVRLERRHHCSRCAHVQAVEAHRVA